MLICDCREQICGARYERGQHVPATLPCGIAYWDFFSQSFISGDQTRKGMPVLAAQKVSFDFIGSHVGSLASGVNATSSPILTSGVL
jgi:hypothetical protein